MSGTAMKIGTQGGRLPTGSKVIFNIEFTLKIKFRTLTKML